MNALNSFVGYVALGFASLAVGLLIMFTAIYIVVGSKGLKRIFAPCKECHFTPNKATWQNPTDGSWHQIQECGRCGRKRDAVISWSAIEAAQKFFYRQES